MISPRHLSYVALWTRPPVTHRSRSIKSPNHHPPIDDRPPDPSTPDRTTHFHESRPVMHPPPLSSKIRPPRACNATRMARHCLARATVECDSSFRVCVDAAIDWCVLAREVRRRRARVSVVVVRWSSSVVASPCPRRPNGSTTRVRRRRHSSCMALGRSGVSVRVARGDDVDEGGVDARDARDATRAS